MTACGIFLQIAQLVGIKQELILFSMPKALANRLMHIEIAGSFNSWKEWAIRSGINEKVLGFLSFRQSYLMGFDSSSDDLAFATPRSWEMVSNLLNCVSDDIDDMFSLISGIVGSGVAVEFRTWAKVYKDLPNIEDVFDGKTMKMPTGTDAMYALTASKISLIKSFCGRYGTTTPTEVSLPLEFLVPKYSCAMVAANAAWYKLQRLCPLEP